MGKSKGSRIVITLECTCKKGVIDNIRKNGVMRYSTCKNKRNTPQRLEIKKFCPQCNQHSLFKEIK